MNGGAPNIEVLEAAGVELHACADNWTALASDVMEGLRFADSVRTGLVNINETTNYWENHLPFGGRAGTDSGTGRVGGRHALERLTELQTIVIG